MLFVPICTTRPGYSYRVASADIRLQQRQGAGRLNNFVEEAVQAAAADMGTVQAAAEAISGAIGQVKPLLSGQTWTGPAADAWEGDWNACYSAVLSCLNALPAAESSVIAGVQRQAEQFVAQHAAAARAS